MRPKTLAIQVFLNKESVLSKLSVDEREINVNGGYTHWNRWKQSTHSKGSILLGVDLFRSTTFERIQAINRSIFDWFNYSKL
ncbi:hypothetical protein F966_01962 [Acinetobacter higginsii]|uniref:Uncharacterized protein n=1 Tax=Acinetobacter higginsii TaxID=70347 RepID=N8WBK5_9GAMM|nr:hypothetical protein F966_01962 [Acinetobacter higginsii]